MGVYHNMSNELQTLNSNKALQEWSVIIRDCRNSGLTVREWCSEHGLRTNKFYYWQKKIFNIISAEKQGTEFAEVPLSGSRLHNSSCSSLATVHVNDFEVEVPTSPDIENLARLFAMLKQC